MKKAIVILLMALALAFVSCDTDDSNTNGTRIDNPDKEKPNDGITDNPEPEQEKPSDNVIVYAYQRGKLQDLAHSRAVLYRHDRAIYKRDV
jgi:hypothetical protein